MKMLISLPEIAPKVRYFIAAIVILVTIIDLYLYFNKTKNDTISNIVRDWVYKDNYFFITLGWGILGGHFFLGTYLRTSELPTKFNLVIIISSLILTWVISRFYRPNKIIIFQLIVLIIGVLIGHFFWSLNGHSPDSFSIDKIF